MFGKRRSWRMAGWSGTLGTSPRARKPDHDKLGINRQSRNTPYSLLPTPYSLLPTPYSLLPRIPCLIPQLLLDADQLVVLGDAVGARQRAGLDLSGVGGNRNV